MPGGKLTSEQLLGELDLCDELGNSTLRITSRQGLQLHGIPKKHLKERIRRINEIKLSTLAACGDVNRNVMCCPAPHYNDPIHAEMQRLADALAAHFSRARRPITRSGCDDATGEESLSGEMESSWPLLGREQGTALGNGHAGPHGHCPPARMPSIRSSRSTARSTCRGSSRWPSACRATTASICMPTTWA